MRKKYQRKVNHVIHALNKNVQNDNLWLGRFVMYQKDAAFFKYDDNSGGIMSIEIRLYDKLTGLTRDTILEYHSHLSDWKFWMAMNNFIVEDVEVNLRNFTPVQFAAGLPKQVMDMPFEYGLYVAKEH